MSSGAVCPDLFCVVVKLGNLLMTACSLAAMQVIHSSAAAVTATTAATATGKITARVSSVTRSTQDGGSKRAGGQSAAGSSRVIKSNNKQPKSSSTQRKQQPHPVSAQPHPVSGPSSSTTSNNVSYASAVKSSPSLQDKKSSTVNKPVAYVKPTASSTNATNDQQQEDITAEPLSTVFPTAHLSQELLAEDNGIIITSAEEQPKPVKVTNESTVVVPPGPSFVSPVVAKSSSPVTAPVNTRLPSFVPFTFVASPSPSSGNHQVDVITQVTTVTSTVNTQSGNGESGKEGIAEVEEVASKRRRLSPVPNPNTVSRTPNIDHSTKLNIAADPFIPSSLPTVVNHQKSVAINVVTPTVAATPSRKPSMPTACYLRAPMMPPHNIMPVIMSHPQMGRGYAISQQAAAYPSVFPTAVPSHAYQVPPPSIVGLPYAGYPMQQPTMLPVTNNAVHNPRAPSYNVFIPQAVTASNILPPAPHPPAAAAAAVHHARVEQRKKEEQLKVLNDTKRFFEQNASSVAKQQPPKLYKYPTLPVKPQLPVTTEGGRRTLLENPPVAMAMPHPPMASMMSRPLEMSPSTGSKRKRRPPLMPLPPTANNVTMVTPWDKPTNMLY